jgi:hypothetical protein
MSWKMQCSIVSLNAGHQVEAHCVVFNTNLLSFLRLRFIREIRDIRGLIWRDVFTADFADNADEGQ